MTDAGPRALLRFDASPAIGGGHASRCRALAATLTALGWSSTFAVRAEALGVAPELAERGDRLVVLDGPPDDEAERIGEAIALPFDLAIVDHYERGRRFEAACRAWARRVMVIADAPDRGHDADVLLDVTYGRSPAEYDDLVPPTCRRLVGSRYALLRAQFAAARTTALGRREARAPVRRILVGVGATDADDFTGRVLEAIGASGLDVEVDVILGAGAPHRQAVAARAEHLPQPTRLHPAVERVADLMAAADLAVGAMGTMAWERCCLGLPTVAVVLADNQHHVAGNLAATGACRVLGRAAEVSADAVRVALVELAGDADARTRMSRAAASLCDGLGAGRVARILDQGVAGGGDETAKALRV